MARGAQLLCKRQQADERLRVVAVGDRLVEAVQRPAHDLDALVLVGLGLQAASRRPVAAYRWTRSSEKPGAGEELVHRLPAARRPCRSPRPARAARSASGVLARLVELARRDLEQAGSPAASRGWRTSQTCSSSWATIADRAGVATISRCLLAVRVAEALDARPRRSAPPDRLGADALEARAHRRPARQQHARRPARRRRTARPPRVRGPSCVAGRPLTPVAVEVDGARAPVVRSSCRAGPGHLEAARRTATVTGHEQQRSTVPRVMGEAAVARARVARGHARRPATGRQPSASAAWTSPARPCRRARAPSRSRGSRGRGRRPRRPSPGRAGRGGSRRRW